jgi:hypothetical protein
MASQNAQPALLFMPDITGFTEFVSSTDIVHAQSIIQEVLELIIESNQLHLEVGEIEGDAIFFYRLGSAPNMTELLEQVRFMFTRFHNHLRLFDQQRICPCLACMSASALKLKIVAHFGEVTGFSIKKHNKLFGKDVIILHRLLKNSLGKKEYALFTRPLTEGAGIPFNPPGWYRPEIAAEQYDVGEVEFTVSDLDELHHELPDIQPVVYEASSKTITAFTEERLIPAPTPTVFGTIFELSLRPKWMAGVKKVEVITKDLINRIGTQHRCIVDGRKDEVIVTEYAHIDNVQAELVEMNRNGWGGCRFIVREGPDGSTFLQTGILVRKNLFIRLFFTLFLKKRIREKIRLSLDGLAAFCQLALEKKEEEVVLEEA